MLQRMARSGSLLPEMAFILRVRCMSTFYDWYKFLYDF